MYHANNINNKLFDEYRNEKTKDKEANLKQIIVDNFTIEALSKALLINNNGLLVYKDELITLFREADSYKSSAFSGITKNRILEAYDGKDWIIIRKNDEPVIIKRPLLTILGSTTPDNLKNLFSLTDFKDGTVQRWNFITIQDKFRNFTNNEINQSTNNIIKKIYLNLYSNRKDSQHLIELTHEAKLIWIEWQDKIENLRFFGHYALKNFSGYLSKHKNLPIKIASILFHIENCFNTKYDKIQKHHIDTAINISEYLRDETRKIWEYFEHTKESFSDNLSKNLLLFLIKYTTDQHETLEVQSSKLAKDFNKYMSNKYQNFIKYSNKAISKCLKNFGIQFKRKSEGIVYYINKNRLLKLYDNVDLLKH